MPAAFIYLLKLSVSLAVVFLFYQLVLRRLTFYTWNRWYLLGYTLLSFIIPFIDITPALQENELSNTTMIQWVPVLYKQSTGSTLLSFWNIVSLVVIAGMLVMMTRLGIQLFSFQRMKRKAKLISGDAINLYQVDESIIPFSFGNAVFFNVNLHTTEELEKIIRHEFVHVKQRHSIDILFSEILCLLNWYNPFSWMLRAAIRQNLEFVADNQVLENGINKKQYQYLLLKVIGNNQFSIAQKFNFSSLKKRIAMMNKNKSAKLHLLRFLFLLPVLAVILVSFRKEISDTLKGKQKQLPPIPVATSDTVPELTQPNSKGYIINVKDQKGECLLVIKDKTGKEVKRLLLTEWNANSEKFEASYGEIPPPPPPPAPSTALPKFTRTSDNNVDWVEVWVENGEKETYDFKIPAQKAAFEKKYKNIAIPPPPPLAPASSYDAPTAPGLSNYPAPPQPPAAPAPVKLPANVEKININNKKATVTLKNGQKENYDLSKPEQKEKFEIKYGEFVSPPPPPPAKAELREIPVAESVPAKIEVTASATKVELREVPVTVSVPAKIQVAAPAEKVNIIEVPIKTPMPAIQGNPLIVVDGVVTPKIKLDEINPETIASIDVLKSKELVILDGKELPADRRKLTGTFNVVTFSQEQAIKKYGDKGKNGVIEVSTIK